MGALSIWVMPGFTAGDNRVRASAGFGIAEVTTAGLLIAPSRTRFNPTRQAAARNRTNGEFLGGGIGRGTDNLPLGKILNRQVDTRDREALTEQIGAAQAAADADLGDTYYRHWLTALEMLVAAKRASSIEELTRHQ